MDCNLIIEGREILGRVTSIAYSDFIGRCIGLAFVTPAKASIGAQFEIRTDNGSAVTATVVKPPFLKNEIGA